MDNTERSREGGWSQRQLIDPRSALQETGVAVQSFVFSFLALENVDGQAKLEKAMKIRGLQLSLASLCHGQ
jgi:hypothetical protein